MYPERLTNQIAWAKPDPPPNALHTAFTHAHETLLWASKEKGARHTFNYDLINSQDPSAQLSSVWRIPAVPMREKSHGYHPTQNPLRLLRRAVLASTVEGELVFDPFCGSGTSGGCCLGTGPLLRGSGDGAGVRGACGTQDRGSGARGGAARTLCPKYG